ncbi:unnamed protein product [Peronospora belbahrii]|uniref:Uncharacterized protein n=1 Tax=Peronospora belbahrii TaxID=622444 RepID=A0ABN8D0E8_9STRA|nr:unnamed protein product [Peronospora belbahrii]
MNLALETLDRAVRALFTPGVAFASSSLHPLCECIIQQAPNSEWQYLHRFPVLKRHVLRQFWSVAVEMEKIPQTPRKRKKRSNIQHINDVIEYKTVCLASLCQKLAQCELLTLNDVELMERLVNLESLEVLQHLIGRRMLPLRLRMMLLGFTLRNQQEKCLETVVQNWIQQVGGKLLEEVLETTASRGSTKIPLRSTRSQSADKVVRRDSETKLCGFCRGGAVSAEALHSSFGQWDFLVECTQQTAQALEKSGESYETNQAMIALSAFWQSLPVAALTASVKTGRKRKRLEIPLTIEKGSELSMSVATYTKICKYTVGSSAGKTDAFQIMWTSVWDREFKCMVHVKHVTLADAVRHCSIVDAFTSMALLTEAKEQVTCLPGFCAVVKVIQSLCASVFEIVTAFAHVWDSAGSGAFTCVTSPTRKGITPTKRVLQSYLSELMKAPTTRHVATSSSVKKAPESRRVSPLKLLFFLYHLFLPMPHEQQDGSYFRHWDALMIQLVSNSITKGSAKDGIAWCLLLKKCVLDANAEASMAMCCDRNFLRAFERYCHSIMYEIIVHGGEVVSSGGTMRLLLITEESDRSEVRQVLVQMMTIFGKDWIIGLIVLLLRANASLRSKGDFNARGLKTLFFPALVSFMKQSNRADVEERKTGQQQFTVFVHSVNIILNESEPTPLYLVSLMRFCEAWDVYQSSHTKEAPTIANKWGFRAIVDLGVLPELLECYSRDEVIHQETSEALTFVAEVLQNTPNCPHTLEASLFKVLSAVKTNAEQGKCVLPVTDHVLVSHSSNVLQRLLRAVRFAGVTQTRQLMSQLKDAVGTLGELRQQLAQWFSFVEINGAAFAGKESRLELSLLCTRLIRWFPNEFENMKFLLMTPLDSHLVFALKAFVKEVGRSSNKTRQSVLSSTARSSLQSAVRVEMALHSYLATAAFPDLETLTVLLAKAIVKCRSPDAFDHLTKVAEKNGRMLLPEAAVATLSSPLRGIEFSSSVFTQQDEDCDDDEHFKNHARRTKSIIYQENTLKFLADSASIFAGELSWSTVLFGGQSAVIWLPYLFEYVLETDFCEGILQADMLFKCLDDLIRRAGFGDKVLQEAYWLTSLLNTALIACSCRCAGACTNLDESVSNRLRQIVRNVLQVISLPSDTTMATITCNKSGAASQLSGILVLRNLSKVGNLIIKEDNASWLCERFIGEKADSALRTIVSAAWNSEMNTFQATVMQPSLQLFVPFSHWMSGALVYSQSFLEEPSARMRRWERTFTSYVTDLYLHLEFEDVICDLLRAWLTTWITCNIERGRDKVQLLALLPSQVALFRRLGSTPYRSSSHGQVQDSTSIWQLVFVTINLAVDIQRDSVAAEQATELVASTLTTLELVELSASFDFVPLSDARDIDRFHQELEKFLLRPELRVCGIAQMCCLLQYPLELLVCCYVCKIPAAFVVESQQFLYRVESVLRKNFGVITINEFRGHTKDFTLQESLRTKDRNRLNLVTVDVTEIEAFFQYWEDEMLLKYDYIDRERCVAVLKVIHAAMVHRRK